MATTPTASANAANIPRVDTHLAKFSQACTVLLAGVAFLLQQPVNVPITAIVKNLLCSACWKCGEPALL